MGEPAKKKLLTLNDLRGEMELVESRITSTIKALNEHAAKVGDGDGPFGNAEAHKKQIKKMLQSVDDLSTRYLQLVEARDRGNMLRMIDTDEGKISVASALHAVRRPLSWRKAARQALASGWKEANSAGGYGKELQTPQPKYQMYSEADRLKQLDKLAALEIRLKPGKSSANDVRFIELKDDGSAVFHEGDTVE